MEEKRSAREEELQTKRENSVLYFSFKVNYIRESPDIPPDLFPFYCLLIFSSPSLHSFRLFQNIFSKTGRKNE